MKKFLIKLIIFAFLFNGLGYFVFVRNNPYLKRKADYDNHMESFLDKSSMAEVLFLGDSHVYTISNELLLPSVLNGSFPSDSLKDMLLKLKLVLEKNNNLKYIFINCDEHIFSDYRLAINNSELIKRYVSEQEWTNLFHEPTGSKWLQMLEDNYPLLNKNIYIFSREALIRKLKQFPQKKNNSNEKILWQQTSFSAQKTSTIDRIQSQFIGYSNELINDYHKLILYAQSKGVKVIGVHFPTTTLYQKELQALPAKDIVNLTAVLPQLPFDQYFDFNQSFRDPIFFQDMDHLNDNGARKLLLELEKQTGLNLLKS